LTEDQPFVKFAIHGSSIDRDPPLIGLAIAHHPGLE
jgi:hypothetical protein